MPRMICPKGHQWDEPSGTGVPTPAHAIRCPVCGTPLETVVPPGAATPQGPSRDQTPTFLSLGPTTSGEPVNIPGYTLLEEIGRGGMGIVYRGKRAGEVRSLALKVIRKERLVHPEAVQRFRREAQAAARLSHPNIVELFEAGQHGDVHYLAMEHVEGVTLQRMVELWGCLPVPQACDYVRQVAMGLQHAHEQALVHRDIKPANVMAVLPGNQQVVDGHARFRGALVKVLDMGVARLNQLSDNQEEFLTTLTVEGAMLGTPDYIAPEQLEDARRADIRADLYSLGCMFHFLLTGQVPFPGGTLIQKLDRQRWDSPLSVESLRPDVPPGVGAVVRKLTAKKPADRYQTPAELAAALEQLARTGQLPAEPRPPAVRETRKWIAHRDIALCVALSPDGRLALTGGKDRTLKLWEVDSGREVRAFPEQKGEVAAVCFTADGRRALVASGAAVSVWDVSAGRELGRFQGHTGAVKCVAVPPDGRRAVSGGEDRALRQWDTQSLAQVRRLTAHTREVTGTAFTPDGRQLLSGSRDGTLRLWDMQSGAELRRFGGQGGAVLALAIAPDGRTALSGHFDTTVRLWEVSAGRELRRFQGHRQMVSAVSFAGDGHAVSGGPDQVVRVWDLGSAREVCRCEGASAAVNGLAVTPGGRGLIAVCSDGHALVWQLPE